jgi:DNA-directed RNA polymerase subunit RPC12/RpoP
MSDPHRKWIDAAIRIGNDAGAKVRCPKCGHADLKVWDIPFDDGYERAMECPDCGAMNFLLMRTSKLQ